MLRRARLCVAGIPWHIIQRGNNRAVCFYAEEDYRCYLDHLSTQAKRYGCAIHACVLMTNHVHLLLTPQTIESAGLMMKHLGQRYVQYINRSYRRSGTLWEGRFRSCLVQSEDYFLECSRYIKLNPVRAGMVKHPHDYRWTSYHANGDGKPDSLIVPHAEYLGLGLNEEDGERTIKPCFVLTWSRSWCRKFGKPRMGTMRWGPQSSKKRSRICWRAEWLGEVRVGPSWVVRRTISRICFRKSWSVPYCSSYFRDGLGSTIQLNNQAGEKVAGYIYDPYGNTTADPSVRNPFQYTGRENDGTGLYYYRARYYSPRMQRFISSDPIGLGGGINTYGYVGGNPVSSVDPTGQVALVGGVVGTVLVVGGVIWWNSNHPVMSGGGASDPYDPFNYGGLLMSGSGSNSGLAPTLGAPLDPWKNTVPIVSTPTNWPFKDPSNCEKNFEDDIDACKSSCGPVSVSRYVCIARAYAKLRACQDIYNPAGDDWTF